MTMIRDYTDTDEQGWLRCRALAFLDTAYFDDVNRTKERYTNPAVELVAEIDGEVVGILDLELDGDARVASDGPGPAGMIWHIAVHPDFRRRGIASGLLEAARAAARKRGVVRFEAWTRDDPWVQAWYERTGFERRTSYLHVYVDGTEDGVISQVPNLIPSKTFAHFTGPSDQFADVRRRYRRVHECVRYDLRLEPS
jgi:ribosomal protein S18 acetylase RimI-like enzyme